MRTYLHTFVGDDSDRFVFGSEFYGVTEYDSPEVALREAADLWEKNVLPDVEDVEDVDTTDYRTVVRLQTIIGILRDIAPWIADSINNLIAEGRLPEVDSEEGRESYAATPDGGVGYVVMDHTVDNFRIMINVSVD